ncbi:plasmid fertility inhibition factor family protein [Ralstonia sp. L16]|uniref:plasmid fertility inhibition factor family protein n=1 Tax=Ralstonia sp. L16 TaxID=3423950 RepID=UPI003F7A67F4
MTFGQSSCTATAYWDVRVPALSPYGFTRLTRAACPNPEQYCVLVVKADDLLACADRALYTIELKAVPQWYVGKMYGMEDFLRPGHARVPEMPRVTVSMRRRHTLLGLMGVNKEAVVRFINGEHRARYMAFAGATEFPVEVMLSEADLLQRHCGA